MEKNIEIKLVSPEIWQQVIEESFSNIQSRTRAVAHSVLRTLHNRHVGITPRLAAELAPLLIPGSSFKERNNTWSGVLKRLRRETSEPRYSFGIMLSTVPSYSVLRLAMPILEQACRRVGLCFLFCQDSVENGVSLEDYNRYAEDLSREIKAMSMGGEELSPVFWKDRAMTLAAYSRRGGIGESFTNNLPETNPMALSLLTRLNPVLSKTPPLPRYTRRLTDPLQHREENRIREGGFSGIHITRRPEEVGDILLSEFVNPPAVFTDRLINTGFLALRRQTRREQLRDVLLAGIMPARVTGKLSRDFIKGCWFDFIRRFGSLLAQSNRKRSEFRWLEGNSLNRVRECFFLLQDLPEEETISTGKREFAFSKEFLLGSGWLPQYMDTRYRYGSVIGNKTETGGRGHNKTGTGTGFVNGELESIKAWISAVWRNQVENRQWLNHEPERIGSGTLIDRPLRMDEFAMIHLMLFLPARLRTQNRRNNAAFALGTLTGGLALKNIPGHNVSITWVPEQITALDRWAYDCRGKGEALVFSKEKTGEKLNSHQIAGRLEEVWRNRLMKEIKSL